MNEKMTLNELIEKAKDAFDQGKDKAIELWDDHKDGIVGCGVLATAIVGGMLLGGASGKKSMRNKVEDADRARLKAESERDNMCRHLEAELLANESSERLHSIVLLPDGQRMTGAHFIDVVLENGETKEILDIVNR